MNASADNARLARLRALRNRPERNLSIAGSLAAETARVKRAHRAVGGAGAAWAAAAPAGLRDRCEVARFARGILTVRVPDDSTRFAVDRWLRSGGQRLLASRTPATLTRVRLVF